MNVVLFQQEIGIIKRYSGSAPNPPLPNHSSNLQE